MNIEGVRNANACHKGRPPERLGVPRPEPSGGPLRILTTANSSRRDGMWGRLKDRSNGQKGSVLLKRIGICFPMRQR